ncbi:MAG: hypothetical protein QOD60_1060 [Solirubrobacterales bacterium]|nr:hypothetical protein [Solirubrobacterales bacterium]
MSEHNEIVENDVVRRLIWAGLVAAIGALASIVAHRGAEAIWVRVFDEEPPE